MNFLIDELPGDMATRVRTETRIQVPTPGARRMFAAYWLLIRLGSRLIRKMMLRAIKRRAEDLSRNLLRKECNYSPCQQPNSEQ